MNSGKGPSPICTGKGEDEQPLLPGGGGGELEGGWSIVYDYIFCRNRVMKIFLSKDLLTDSHFNKTNFKVHITYPRQRYQNQPNQNSGT